jgi:FtsP/CotA-like multicopper oxidase with cupredoxin domain
VNGVLWPKKSVDPGWYRLRLVDGSDSRCWTIGFTTIVPLPGKKPANNVPYYVLANDQGYLANPVKLDPLISPAQAITMCPGERYELLIDFSAFPAGTTVTMTNVAGAPFPAGITPFAQASPFAHLNVIMQFQVVGSGVVGAVPITAANNPKFLNPALNATTKAGQTFRATAPAAVRQIYLNEKVDGVTLAPLGMQLNGVPFEYKVTETPKNGTVEKWQFINLTVDAHPMHPHLVKHQIVSRQPFNVGAYKALLCGSSTCQPGPAPGNEMQLVPDVTPLLQAGAGLVLPTSWEGGWKDASQAPPGFVTTIIAKWEAGWELAGKMSPNPTAPGTRGGLDAAACNPAGTMQPIPDPANPGQCLYVMQPVPDPAIPGQCLYVIDPATGLPVQPLQCQMQPVQPLQCQMQLVAQPLACSASTWTYESVSSGPYVWHCHINSHEDSEMMRTSLVIP